MEFKPKFVSVDDYNNYWSDELDSYFSASGNSSNQSNVFLARVEDRLINWLDANTFRIYRFDNLTPFQLEQFRKAILTQAKYMIKQGDIGMDSGYDAESGLKIKRGDLVMLTVCPAALDFLKNAGLFNQKMTTYPRTLRGWGATLGYFGSYTSNDENGGGN